MKRFVDLTRVTDRDLRGQQAVAATTNAVQRDRALGVEERDLAARVDTGIRTRGAADPDIVLHEGREHLLEVLLHGRTVRLALPAVETGAVVLDDQTDVPHEVYVSEVRFDADAAGVLSVARLIMEHQRTVVPEVQPQRMR